MKTFLALSGAAVIAIVGVAITSFPFLALFGIIGFFYIQEHFEEE